MECFVGIGEYTYGENTVRGSEELTRVTTEIKTAIKGLTFHWIKGEQCPRVDYVDLWAAKKQSQVLEMGQVVKIRYGDTRYMIFAHNDLEEVKFWLHVWFYVNENSA